jgi:HK97 family phage portal protein
MASNPARSSPVGFGLGDRIRAAWRAAFGTSQYAQLWLSGEEERIRIQGPGAQPYLSSSPLYSTVSLIVESAAQPPIRISDSADRIVESGPLYEFLQEPQRGVDQASWIEQVVGHLVLGGRVHLLLTDFVGRRPLQAVPIGRSQMSPIVDKRTGRLRAWRFEPADREAPVIVSLDEVVTIKTFNPYDPHDGLNPLEPANLDISQHWQADRFNEAALANGAEPGGALFTDQQLTEDQIERLKSQWNSRHRGAANAKRVAILHGGLSWQQIATAHEEMQFAELRNQSLRAIARAFKVPMPMLSDEATSTFANYETAERVFWQVAVARPLLRIACALTNQLAPRFSNASRGSSERRPVGLNSKRWVDEAKRRVTLRSGGVWIWPDMETIPAVQQMRWERTKQLGALIDAGVPLRKASEALDLGIDTSDLAWADTYFVPHTQVPVEAILSRGDQRPETRHEAGEKDSSGDERRTKREDRSWTRELAPLARSGRARVRRWMLELEENVAGEIKDRAVEFAGRTTADDADGAAFPLFDLKDESEKLSSTMLPVHRKSARIGLNGTANDSGESEQSDSPIDEIVASRQGLLISLAVEIRNRLSDSVAAGLRKGEGDEALIERVRSRMKEMRPRAARIARTEIMQAASAARERAERAGDENGEQS